MKIINILCKYSDELVNKVIKNFRINKNGIYIMLDDIDHNYEYFRGSLAYTFHDHFILRRSFKFPPIRKDKIEFSKTYKSLPP